MAGFARSGFAIVILTALVLGISYLVREISTFPPQKLIALASLSNPFFDKLANKTGIDKEKIDQAGAVAGRFVERVNEAGKVIKDKAGDGAVARSPTISESTTAPQPLPNAALRAAIVADIHDDLDNFNKALDKIQELGITTVFLLGDETNLGVLENLQSVKNALDARGLNYYAIPGDHDLWKTSGPQNFLQIFGSDFHALALKDSGDVKFVILNNSANYSVIPDETITKFEKEIANASFILLAQPLYHPSGAGMGIVNDEEITKVRKQAEGLLSPIRASNVKAVIAADLHSSSRHPDPEKPSLEHIVVGAVAAERNLQTPRFSVLSLLPDGSYALTDLEL